MRALGPQAHSVETVSRAYGAAILAYDPSRGLLARRGEPGGGT